MLLWLAEYLTQYYSAFGVFQYLTMRGIMGVLTALFIAMAIGPYMIERLKAKQIGQSIRQDGPKSHLVKEGTPTMPRGFLRGDEALLCTHGEARGCHQENKCI